MVLSTPNSARIDSCRHLLEGQAKNLADRLYGVDGPPAGVLFAEIERTVSAVASDLRKRLFDLLLARQAEALHRHLDAEQRRCPSCGGDTCPREPEPRVLFTPGVVVEWLEPQRFCGKCRRAYFPQSRLLGIDLGQYSNSLLDLIVYAGANQSSFREASVHLHKMSGQAVPEKQVERLSKRIGLERLQERDALVADFKKRTLKERCDETPEGVQAPGEDRVAVVMADAGMLQLRDPVAKPAPKEKPATSAAPPTAPGDVAVTAAPLEEEDIEDESAGEEGSKPSGRHWREDKVGLVMTMSSTVTTVDPCPEIPDTFLDQERVTKIVRGLKKSAALAAEEGSASAAEGNAAAMPENAAAIAENAAAAVSDDEAERIKDQVLEEAEYKGPKLVSRQVVASRQSWPLFGVILACAAWLAGFATAKRKAFVADGAGSIWRVWQQRFSSYTPILDFIHAMTYIYAAAKAVAGESSAEGWRLYSQWIRWVWAGEVAKVIKYLEQWQAEHVRPRKARAQPLPGAWWPRP
jgi:hypothetical protein